MLVTDAGDEKFWWQLLDIGDDFSYFVRQDPLSFRQASGTNIQKMSTTSNFNHKHPQIVVNFKSSASK